MSDPQKEPLVVDLLDCAGEGPVWGTATEDLNATFLAWRPGDGTPEHVNDERDVVVAVLRGGGVVEIDGRAHTVAVGSIVVIPKGAARAVTAGEDGIAYLSVHLRRGRLSIAPAGRAPVGSG